ncbi:MAG: Porphobilinogen deaminase [Chitinophagaceae bacterium]|nr:Porphobilinogen deaminase [Chitinophagaceae bacterium]
MMRFVIGTRGSKLALWQAEHVSALLQAKGAETEIKIIDTKGDQILNQSLSEIGSKGLFTEELETELKQGLIDLAVHSAKDMPSVIPQELELIAFSEREKVNDVVLSLNNQLTLKMAVVNDFKIGTSSTRRRAALNHYYPGIHLVDMRGNLQTRLRKMEEGQCDAMILAYAGVHRMNMSQYIVEELSEETFTPAVGQGALAIETAVNLSAEKKAFLKATLNDVNTEYCLLAERSFLKTMEGGCSVPVFALGKLDGDNLILKGGVISLDGTRQIEGVQKGNKKDALAIGNRLADDIIAQGGLEILEEIKKNKK